MVRESKEGLDPHLLPFRIVVADVRIGSYLAVPLTSGGGLLSGVKLKKHDQELTLGSKVGLLQESGRTPWRPRTAGCSHKPTWHLICLGRSGQELPRCCCLYSQTVDVPWLSALAFRLRELEAC